MERRQTIQKVKILEFLKKTKSHPTAEMIYDAVKKEIPTITLATVYRNLNLMADSGEILKLEVNGQFRFDGDTCNHQHCICRKCGKITDMFQKEINEYAIKKFKSDKFTPSCVKIIFSGYCKGCRKNDSS